MDPRHIALDATYSLGDDLSGVGVYSRALLLGLAAAHSEARFDWYFRPHRYARAWESPAPPNCRRRLLIDRFPLARPALFHGLNQRLPAIRARVRVATFHDLFVMTGQYSTPEFRARFTAQAQVAAARADAIIAVSAFTARQAVDLLRVDAAKVHVVHHGVRPLAYPPLARERIVLHVGAVQARKNIARLVDAFAAIGPEWTLVLAGAAGFGADAIFRHIERSPARSRIRVAGYVTADELGAWYARASLFAFPSLDEGFGMPVLEAMAAGVPVLTSNRSSLPEVAGDAAVLVDPEDADALAGELRRLTLDADLRRDLVRRGALHVQDFSWDRAAAQTWAVYRDLLS